MGRKKAKIHLNQQREGVKVDLLSKPEQLFDQDEGFQIAPELGCVWVRDENGSDLNPD